jgi:hypothetical protein
MIAVKLMGSSIIDKKSPPLRGRPEHRVTDLRWRTKRKRASPIREQLSLSSRYFLKRLRIDISQNPKASCPCTFLAYRRSVLTRAIKESGIKTARETRPFS